MRHHITAIHETRSNGFFACSCGAAYVFPIGGGGFNASLLKAWNNAECWADKDLG